MDVKCGGCSQIVAKEDRRFKPPRLKATGGCSLEQQQRSAPRIKCGKCGKITILIKGEV